MFVYGCTYGAWVVSSLCSDLKMVVPMSNDEQIEGTFDGQIINMYGVQARHPDWPVLTAYERTKIVCEELVANGATIPAWMTLRELIGKGSSADINRGKEDFRQELAEKMRASRRMPQGLPAPVSEMMTKLWDTAMTEASKSFNDDAVQNRELLAERDGQIANLHFLLQEADMAKTRLERTLDEMENDLVSTNEIVSQLRQDNAALTNLKQHLEQQLADTVARFAEQQKEIDKAVHRLEAVEDRALMRVEEVRQAYQAKLDDAASQIKRKDDDFTLRSAKYATLIKETNDRADALAQRNAEKDIVLATLNERVAMLTKQVSELGAERRAGSPVKRQPIRRR